jgi:RimJ/RimL family protein N-acetyltransferase
MSHPAPTAATTSTTSYELRVAGHLDDHWATWLDQSTLVRQDDGTTVLTGSLSDQSQLHGVLARIRDLGAPLVSLSTLDPPALSAPMLSRPLFTDRLTLRPAGEGDAAATWRYRRLPSVAQWLTELPTDLETYRTTFTNPERLSATVMVECGGHVVGDLMLRAEDAWAQAEVSGDARAVQAELGWVLDPAQTGHGLATEAVGALLRYCFTERGVRRVVASCFLDNERSWRLMERLGMRREGHAVAESLHRSGQWLDTVSYAMLAAEWSP